MYVWGSTFLGHVLKGNIRHRTFVTPLLPPHAATGFGRTPSRPRKSGTRGMPRAARERLILDVAGQVFARAGYHSASMDEIAELAGVSKPMLYAYFGSKEGLYVAYIDRTGRELLDRMVGAARREDPPVLRMRARVAAFPAF